MKKQLYILVVLTIAGLIAKAQQLTPHTLNTAGKSKSAGGLLLEDALGGLVVQGLNSTAMLYTPDFLQPDAGITTTPPPIGNLRLDGFTGLDNGGTTFSNGSHMLEFTVGEFASITLSQPGKMLTQGILQPYTSGSPLPVRGLEFYARRISNTQVQLDLKTVQEINNKGFHVERQKEHETNFSEIGFVASKALNGNSSLPLQYQQVDNNNFSGKTYYRIRQEDIDGDSEYSVVRVVNGNSRTMSIRAWPVPSTGPVNILVSGIEKEDRLLLFDMNGKLVQQHLIQNDVQIQLKALIPGTYLIRLAINKDLMQKIVVQ